ncbi:N-formylglutamate amidohydrolase [Tsuneonella dongtanensis]|uniref:N-formylglutamate amidohydrolase n=1 Tax=Tsuneonella dongtanensis TaxID=692370 RepID=A0A1B2AF70_9SPHN|nr:N-formylglutamate amidohydrolase [Tsuneonella dongtanensis]ANY20793.1 N-formylglutamate amidohydrolase [Tsuneonella dongtanensis]
MISEWQPWRHIGPEPRRRGIVLIADHASNFVPDDIVLGIEPALMNDHIAIDIGVEGVAERMARRHGVPAHVACVSRLVCDLNRDEDDPRVVPASSDGHTIPGNIGADLERRLDRFHRPYHHALADWLDHADPGLVISLHSFTPALKSAPASRPWEVGILYNTDDRAARHGIRLFGEAGLTVGDNEPYSGRDLNATMNRHAEAHGRAYLGIEVRQDQIDTEAGQARWAALIADVAGRVALMLEAA